MITPFNQNIIPRPNGGDINPMPSMPLEQFGRSIDRLPLTQSGGGGGGVIPPLWLEQVDDENVKVKSGTVNGIIPTGVASNIDVSGTDGTWNVYLNASLTSSGTVSTVTITATTASVPSDTSTNAYLLDGTVDVASSIITAVSPTLAWSQTFVACTPEDPNSYYWVVA